VRVEYKNKNVYIKNLNGVYTNFGDHSILYKRR